MAETDVPEIELIIKASTIDGRRKGACIFCQVDMTLSWTILVLDCGPSFTIKICFVLLHNLIRDRDLLIILFVNIVS